MVPLVLKFVACVRAAGLRVSTAEVLDALAQVPRIDVLDEDQFRTVMRANMAKSRLAQWRFDRLYHLFFHELREEIEDPSVSLAPHVAAVTEAVAAMATVHPALASIADFMAGDPAAYLGLLRNIESEGGSPRQGPGANLGALVRRLPVLRALGQAQTAVDDYAAANRDRIHWETRRQFQRHFKRRLESARRLLTGEAPPAAGAAARRTAHPERFGQLGERSFAALTPAEVQQMRDVIARLVKKLKDTLGLRYAARARGLLDVKKTLRRAARYQGVPLEIRRRRRPRRKGRIVVLCDVSGSVWSSARFMLNMLYALQDCFDRVRSFVFVAGLAEVTRLFDQYAIDVAIAKVLTDSDLCLEAATNYGLTLRQFEVGYMDALNKKTTVIVIGDGRSNYGNPEEQILEAIRDRSRRLIWLNPESEAFWYTGDSEMRTYEALCNEVRPAKT